MVFHGGKATGVGDDRLFTISAFDYDTGAWIELALNDLGPDAYHGMMFHEATGTILVFGGGSRALRSARTNTRTSSGN